jgi:predicted acylesterase/phospholipase RssA
LRYDIISRDQHFQLSGPKRILTLDGGGIRGIVTLGYLKRMEDLLKVRFCDEEGFRLAHYFDLIAGTSTGAIIAAGLARGMKVDEISKIYLELGAGVFQKSFWRQGVFRSRYSHNKLSTYLRDTFGADTTLGDASIITGLLIITKRIDTGSIWPLGNNPRSKYFEASENDDWVPNKSFPLWKVVRASSAAPSYFDREVITISEETERQAVRGEFIDGGVSPFNNPALQAFIYATVEGHRVCWKTGAEDLLIVSVGTGRGDPSRKQAWGSAKGAIQSLFSMMDDSASLVETLMQLLSTGETHRVIDEEIGALDKDFIGEEPRFTYVRYDLPLVRHYVNELKPNISEDRIDRLKKMDDPRNMELLKELANQDAIRKINSKHFPASFDLNLCWNLEN